MLMQAKLNLEGRRIRDLHLWMLSLSDIRLWLAIFIGRALILSFVLLIFNLAELGPRGEAPQAFELIGSTYLLLYVFVLAPFCETLFECTLPHLIMRDSISSHPWLFATLSALLMVVIHPMGIILSIAPTITGYVLAYCYLSFYQRHSRSIAFAATCAMHTAGNVVGTGIATVVLMSMSPA